MLEACTSTTIPQGTLVPIKHVDVIRMGTTVATNALLERRGERTALVVTAGCRDLLEIGTQARPKIFDLAIRAPDVLYERVIEANERVVPAPDAKSAPEPGRAVVGTNGESFVVRQPLDTASLRTSLVEARVAGISSVAVVLLHAYAVPQHEEEVGALCVELGFSHVSLSHRVMPMVKAVARGNTTCADAYLSPHIDRYLRCFASGFERALEGVEVLFMQSDGGMTDAAGFSGHKAILSGPAGGVVGYAMTTTAPADDDDAGCAGVAEVAAASPCAGHPGTGAAGAVGGHPVVGLDMGGTSTDVSRYDGHTIEHVYETTTAGVTVQAPQIDIHTVAAGGGSRLFFRSGMFVVGPESAGAHPGPVCYRKGGYLAVTDANAALGRLQPAFFPAIFGPREDEALDVQGSVDAVAAVAAEIDAHSATEAASAAAASQTAVLAEKSRRVDEVALGFVEVANEAMCRPIRALTQMRGYSAASHTLACFGGAAGQHACAIARSLGMSRVFVQRYSGILSAYGIGLADIVEEAQAAVSATLAPPAGAVDSVPAPVAAVARHLADRASTLARGAVSRLTSRGYAEDSIQVTLFANLRYKGTDTALMVACNVPGAEHMTTVQACAEDEAAATVRADAVAASAAAFVRQYQQEFGFALPDREVLADDVRARAVARSTGITRAPCRTSGGAPLPAPVQTASVFFRGGRRDTPIFRLEQLARGHTLHGPALLIDSTATVLIEPGFRAVLSTYGDVVLRDSFIAPSPPPFLTDASAPAASGAGSQGSAKEPCDPVQLSLFGHRFMGIAEQMGRTLQRTSISVNIKERLDFSCALFAPDGGLVANAPHLPVHLGAMSEAVRCQLRHWGEDLADGDVLVSNHPQLAGGSHLPDITVITPVFAEEGARGSAGVCFFVASRGHHADIGGIAPGSMPPMSKRLEEEGAAIVAFKLVQGGEFQEAGITELLLAPGESGVPGCSGSRNLADSLSDLRAQVAANRRGITLVRELIAEYGLPTVHAYMAHIRDNSKLAVQDLLLRFAETRGWVSSSSSLSSLATPSPFSDAAGASVVGGGGEALIAASPYADATRLDCDTVGARRMRVTAEDCMDDGTPIRLAITIDEASRTADFDFSGTGPEVYGNTNAPPAVTHSAVIYVLRALIDQDIPLNQGCLEPVAIRVPRGSLLHPSVAAAVVGGNVLTSQRVVDVILRAFEATAASQGCMNNLTFGDSSLGYYETICGGAGAGRGFHGRSGTQVHMTNTRATDVEVLERRYPVVVRRFHLREGSGGAGRWRGGDGAVRALEFRRPLTVSILSERRAIAPFGMLGGLPASKGRNLLHRADGRVISLGGKATVEVVAGEVLEILTPGGGGYGSPSDAGEAKDLATSGAVADVPHRSGGGSLGKHSETALTA